MTLHIKKQFMAYNPVCLGSDFKSWKKNKIIKDNYKTNFLILQKDKNKSFCSNLKPVGFHSPGSVLVAPCLEISST